MWALPFRVRSRPELCREAEMADAVRLTLRTTHNLAEGAGAASLAGLLRLRDRLAGEI